MQETSQFYGSYFFLQLLLAQILLFKQIGIKYIWTLSSIQIMTTERLYNMIFQMGIPEFLDLLGEGIPLLLHVVRVAQRLGQVGHGAVPLAPQLVAEGPDALTLEHDFVPFAECPVPASLRHFCFLLGVCGDRGRERYQQIGSWPFLFQFLGSKVNRPLSSAFSFSTNLRSFSTSWLAWSRFSSFSTR